MESEGETSKRNYRNTQVHRERNVMQVKHKSHKSNLKASKGNDDQPIPTVVNGIMWRNKNKETDQKYNEYKENDMNEKKGFTRHRVLLLGDSHMRGCTDELKRNLNGDFTVSGIVKPGTKTKDILGTRIGQDMSKDDTVVVWAGTNDIGTSNVKEGIKNIVNFVKGSRHTNIIIMEALHRHDLIDWSCVNEETERFNRLLAKRLKLYKQAAIGKLQLDRQHFTRQGTHMNYEGKIRACQQIAKLVQRKLRVEDYSLYTYHYTTKI
jgi:hypothetical protein